MEGWNEEGAIFGGLEQFQVVYLRCLNIKREPLPPFSPGTPCILSICLVLQVSCLAQRGRERSDMSTILTPLVAESGLWFISM